MPSESHSTSSFLGQRPYPMDDATNPDLDEPMSASEMLKSPPALTTLIKKKLVDSFVDLEM